MFDVGQNLKYPLDDEKWAEKILIGGALNVIPIINFFSMGYTLESMRAGTRGETTLPEWQDWGDKFVAGLMVFVISFAYMLVPSILMCLGAGGLVGMMHFGDVGWGIAGGGLTLLTFDHYRPGFILPMALAHFVAEDRIGAAFEFGEVWRRIRTVFETTWWHSPVYGIKCDTGNAICDSHARMDRLLFGVFISGCLRHLIGRLYHQASAGIPQ